MGFLYGQHLADTHHGLRKYIIVTLLFMSCHVKFLELLMTK